MSGPLRWEVEGRAWPHRAFSRFVAVHGLRWHVQQMGQGPAVVLIHGTGASSHSWRAMMPTLAERFSVIAPDLPGHGFTQGRLRGGPSLPHVAGALAGLLEALDVAPALLVGHSAGAAIALEMAGRVAPAPVLGFSAALLPFPGVAARLFPALAKMLFVNPFVPSIFARMARARGETERFLKRATGSRIDAEGLRCYELLLGNSSHCAGALAMMANWDLTALEAVLPALAAPVLLAHGDRDPAIPLASARQAAALLPSGRLEPLSGLGHLAHEEQPELACALIARFAAEHAIATES